MVIDAAGKVTQRYVYGAMGEVLFDQRLDPASGDQTDLLMPVADHAGSTIAVLDDSLTLLKTIDYAPFGEIDELRELDAGTGQYTAVPNATPADLDTVFGYHGRAYDPATGLGHHAARWYDPHSGRFLSEDPIAADVNTYRFAGNDPINYGDPSLSPNGNFEPVFIPEAAAAAFRKPVPVGIGTGWKRLTGQQYAPRGFVDLTTGEFTRTGVNRTQALWYTFDLGVTGAAVGGAYWYATEGTNHEPPKATTPRSRSLVSWFSVDDHNLGVGTRGVRHR